MYDQEKDTHHYSLVRLLRFSDVVSFHFREHQSSTLTRGFTYIIIIKTCFSFTSPLSVFDLFFFVLFFFSKNSYTTPFAFTVFSFFSCHLHRQPPAVDYRKMQMTVDWFTCSWFLFAILLVISMIPSTEKRFYFYFMLFVHFFFIYPLLYFIFYMFLITRFISTRALTFKYKRLAIFNSIAEEFEK